MRLTRRTMLRGLGGIAVGLPFLEASSRARADATGPRRLVVFFTAGGNLADQWITGGGERDFVLGPVLAPLEAHRDKLLILRGIDMESVDHGPGGAGHEKPMCHMLTATECIGSTLPGLNGVQAAGGISVDQEAARRIGGSTRLRSVELGVQTEAPGSDKISLKRMCYTGPNMPLAPENDPRAAFTRLFAGFDPTAGTAVDALRIQRRSVLDAVLGDVSELRRSLGAADQMRLDEHLASVRELERQLDFAPMSSCGVPASPVSGSFEANGRAQLDLLAHALACDITRVASIQWGRAVHNLRYTFIGAGMDSHHEMTHRLHTDAAAYAALQRIETWYAQQFAYLVQKLGAMREGDGTVLDHSVIVWCNELSDGERHAYRDMRYVLAGGACGSLRTGRYLTYSGDPHGNLLTSLLNAVGVPATSFGNPAYCTGPLSGLT